MPQHPKKQARILTTTWLFSSSGSWLSRLTLLLLCQLMATTSFHLSMSCQKSWDGGNPFVTGWGKTVKSPKNKEQYFKRGYIRWAYQLRAHSLWKKMVLMAVPVIVAWTKHNSLTAWLTIIIVLKLFHDNYPWKCILGNILTDSTFSIKQSSCCQPYSGLDNEPFLPGLLT